MLVNTLNKPWLHFVLVGVLLYGGQRFFSAPAVATIAPLSPQQIATMRGQWLRTTGQPIKPQQLQQLIDSAIDQEILFREAISRDWHLNDPLIRQRLIRDMRFLEPETTQSDERLFSRAIQLTMHENDLVVRRRLIQMMERSAFATVASQQPSESVLKMRFQQSSEQFVKPAIIGFEHIFINRDKHSAPEQRAKQILTVLSSQRCDRSAATSLNSSDAFLHGLKFEQISSRQVERYFGRAFAEQLLALAALQSDFSSAWLGPVSSSYGLHLICLRSFQSPKPQPFAEVRPILLAQWQREQQQAALRTLMTTLRQRYEVRP